jgi:prolyl-tRNA synthetase
MGDRVRELAATLQRAGIRTHVDGRPQLSPGFKFNDWEMRDVPIRLKLGLRELAAGTALMSRRLGYPQPGDLRPRLLSLILVGHRDHADDARVEIERVDMSAVDLTFVTRKV